ncbi:hypothetical protein SAMN05192529_11929 [Arachidicoccus rhizosphaerae]|uniref:Uncharacterized protein n=1 Tax=Arachidicoccus rhizosphaerae TaxID=551991 RepID=A0A1H4B992_9BACT|nr:FAD-dependent monooxygenase [Arachidicoccus rhizosphaerae]SEA44709.1 hypothetical protein SAMN05192529_11929 [Arachidicoccus rhizosphaerae]
MQKEVHLRLPAQDYHQSRLIKKHIAQALTVKPGQITGFQILKKSMDARQKQIYYNLSLLVFIEEAFQAFSLPAFPAEHVRDAKHEVLIIGAGPAGLYAALTCLEYGIRPVILERGKDVQQRRRDLAALNRQGVVNPNSNYCFGEGGAGTYSDGKLYTRSKKRGSIQKALETFVRFGADPSILYEAHPHIGTNKLPTIITNMREAILAYGGEIHFNQQITDFTLQENQIRSVITHTNDRFDARHIILATGHSARDIYRLLHSKHILIESKAFALGVRVEHPQSLINQIQYKCSPEQMVSQDLPPAAYSLVAQVADRGVFSFCMCPGGIIAPAATDPGELVVNGWSPSKRNNPFANSGMVVQVDNKSAFEYLKRELRGKCPDPTDPLLLMDFQQQVEQVMFQAGGGGFRAPGQRLTDFCSQKKSKDLPTCSYIPGVTSARLDQLLPDFIAHTLAGGLRAFGQKMKGYYTDQAILVGTESRTSSPVRIPREELGLHHPQITNLYPAAEGAGYAGGIISAAIDGTNIAATIAAKLGIS